MAELLTVQTEFEILTCGDCGIQFAVPKWWVLERRRDHREWRCPNGHIRFYPTESDVERANREKREAELRAQAQINEAQHLQLVAEHERDKALKSKRAMERRISKGVCPCCNRTFGDLHKHMETKHKGYGLPPGRNPKQIEGPVQ